MRVGGALFFFLSSRGAFSNADDATSGDQIVTSLQDTIMTVVNTGLGAVDTLQIDAIQDDSAKCNISSFVTCIDPITETTCEELIIPIEECGMTEMDFTFKFCNYESDNPLELFTDKTEALIENVAAEVLDYSDLAPGQCRDVTMTRQVNTCRRFFSASLKVEGKRGPLDDGSDYCYAWDFNRIFIRRGPCDITSDIASCKVDRTGENCKDFIVPLDECSYEEPMTFTYEYCNNEGSPLKFRRQMTIVLVEMRDMEGLNLEDLPPGECRTYSVTQPINTCKRYYSTSLKVEGWRGQLDSDYCYAYDFDRIYTLRPGGGNPNPGDDEKCEVSSRVTCTVPSLEKDCDDIEIPLDECGELEMAFEFEMCNYEPVQNAFLLGGQKTIALVEMVPVEGLDTSILSPGECRRHRELKTIDTCKRFFSASLKVEGRRGDVYNDYCYAYDFYRSYISRPSDGPGDGNEATCDMTANIKCTVDETGEDCRDMVVPLEECEEGVDMTFTFDFCNREEIHEVSFFRDTRATIEAEDIPGFNFADLDALECRRINVSKKIDTCKRHFSSELLLEAKRGPEVDGTDYCYAYNFYRHYITRFSKPTAPTPVDAPSSDHECAISAHITCTVDSTGENCVDHVVALEDCDKQTPVTYEFEYCNFEISSELKFFEDRSKALIEMNPVERMNFSPLGPGRCRRKIESHEVDTCKKFFSASLQVEAKIGPLVDGSDYCYAYDFLRVFVKRDQAAPSPVISPTPNNAAGSCDFSASIGCTVDDTGDACDEFVISRDDCTDVDMTFEFDYCNLDPSSDIDLIDDLSVALIEMQDVPLDITNMDPLECRTYIETRTINSCKNFFSASLKLEGKRGPKIDGSDYCYGWNFYRGYFQRPPGGGCKIGAEITCTYNNKPCDQMVISEDECGEESIIFDFVYCNEDQTELEFKQSKTAASVNGEVIESMDKSNLNGCRVLTVTQDINTCARSFSAEMRLRGRPVGANEYTCFGYDHYRNVIKRPAMSDSPTLVPSKTISLSPSTSVSPSSSPTECTVEGAPRAARINKAISTMSDPSALADPTSPQSRARDWLINEDTYNVFCANPCSRSGIDGGIFQRYSLVVFYFSMNGDTDWLSCGRNSPEECIPKLTNINQDVIPTTSDNQPWLTTVNECAWGGVACRLSDLCLDRIEFEANNLNGVIPHEIEQFNNLRYLYLEGATGLAGYETDELKYITGTIPTEIQTLEQLLILDLNFNKLEGQIPEGIYGMNELRHLDINNNLLTGTISPNIGNLVNLRFLQLDFNFFTGEIPTELGNAVDLVNADFHRNNFTGFMPGSVCQLRGPGFRLVRLTADCAGFDIEIQCTCCSLCFSDLDDNFPTDDNFPQGA